MATATAIRIFRSKLPEMFARARIKAGRSQRAAASELQVGVHTLSRAECRHQPVDTDMAMRAARTWRSSELAVQAAHEATGMVSAWPDGERYEHHRLTYLLLAAKEDSESDEARAELQRYLTLAKLSEEEAERVKGLCIEILEDIASKTDLVGHVCEWMGSSIAELRAVVDERRKAAGIVRRVA